MRYWSIGGFAAGFLLSTAFAWAEPAAGVTPDLMVEMVPAAKAERAITFELTGTIEASENLRLAFKQPGRVLRVSVEVGDHVERGAEIAAQEDPQARAAQAGARAGVAAAEAAVEQTAQALGRMRELRASGISSQANLDDSVKDWAEAVARLDEARAELAKATQILADMVVVAPSDGIIVERHVEVGGIAAAGQTIAVLATDAEREAVFDVPNLAELDQMLGQKVGLKLIEDQSQETAGLVREISPLARSTTGTVAVRIALGAVDWPLGSGVSGQFIRATDQVISLPAAALMRHRGQPAVWVIAPESRKVAIREITVARYTSATIEVASGLEPGEWVATRGAHLLFPGREVAIKEVQP